MKKVFKVFLDLQVTTVVVDSIGTHNKKKNKPKQSGVF
jgi:hypothetical protein